MALIPTAFVSKSLHCLAIFFALLCIAFGSVQAQNGSAFQPIENLWPSPSEVRLASGAPGPKYWQQKADYEIAVVLDDLRQRISGKATLRYHNNSPHALDHIWLQLDQNLRSPDALAKKTKSGQIYANQSLFDRHFQPRPPFQGGMEDFAVTMNGQLLPILVVETNARIDLPYSLLPGQSLTLEMQWAYAINDARDEGRSGYEYFPEDGNYIYEIAQFFPRVCTYDDLFGWENKPYNGDSEFGLEFGDYDLQVDVPEDHLVAATGTLMNAEEVLNKQQLARFQNLNGNPQFIVSPEEAKAKSKSKAKGRKIWHFKANNVRDVAFASSRKFIWDAARVNIGGRSVLSQAFYPKEGMPLWDKYANHAVMHTLQTYSGMLMEYPYPVATAVHGPVWGMEYPMLAFCGGRPTSSGYYSKQAKYLMIGVVIHEVGHNYFPMIVNSNERRWAWMDEGMNSFCQILAEQSFERGFPLRRGSATVLADMPAGSNQPLMSRPESLQDNSLISYEKAAVGLNILRNEILGPKVFDPAFKKYVQRWAFKHPEPSDFFRTMEDMSGQDLAWFWRSWFYHNDKIEFSISKVKHFLVSLNRGQAAGPDPCLVEAGRSMPEKYYCDSLDYLRDRYSSQLEDENKPTLPADLQLLFDSQLQEKGKPKAPEAYHIYQIVIEKKADGLLPLQIQVWFKDGSLARYQLPAEIWLKGNTSFVKEIMSPKEVLAVLLDPDQLIPDEQRTNNHFPRAKDNLNFEVADLRQ